MKVYEVVDNRDMITLAIYSTLEVAISVADSRSHKTLVYETEVDVYDSYNVVYQNYEETFDGN